MASNAFTLATYDEFIQRGIVPSSNATFRRIPSGLQSEDRLLPAAAGGFKVQKYTNDVATNGSIITNGAIVLFDTPVIAPDGTNVLGWVTAASVADVKTLWNA